MHRQEEKGIKNNIKPMHNDSVSSIDRQALVRRHAIHWPSIEGCLALGNGEFCIGIDGTGLQSFAGNTMAHWSWHTFPLPYGFTADDVPPTGCEDRGRISKEMDIPPGKEALYKWLYENPHSFNLGRVQLQRGGGVKLAHTEISNLTRSLDLWNGLHQSEFQIDGIPVHVETCVHPSLDLIAVHLESSLLKTGGLEIAFDFPYPNLKKSRCLERVGDFQADEKHSTQVMRRTHFRLDLERSLDSTTYHVAISWEGKNPAVIRAMNAGSSGAFMLGGDEMSSPHQFRLVSSGSGELEFLCAYSSQGLPGHLPSFAQTKSAAARHWAGFWNSGGAIDFSESRDPRWKELERRVVISQYLMACQSAGSYVSAEVGLMGMDGWSGQFHMEMVWWHLSHYGLWGRWAMAEEALGCYRKFLPLARKLAEQFGYSGAKWGKMVGPEGRTATWDGSFILHWQQPHPIFLAELAYRLDRPKALQQWQEIVFETAEYMASFPVLEETGGYTLAPIMTAAENGICKDPAFELAYWRFGLDMAQKWRERLGLSREPHWDAVREKLSPLPQENGVYVFTNTWLKCIGPLDEGHMDPIGAFAFLPFVEGVDKEVAARSVQKIWTEWKWDQTWGWDCPWMAMAAARTGQSEIALEALLLDVSSNRYPEHGINGGWYLPGNGALLYAVAMMAAGWDGAPNQPAPGFPKEGWIVRWENLNRAL